VADLSGYEGSLFDMGETAPILSAINQFQFIIESKFFKDTPVFLFLNKKDLAEENLKRVPLELFFRRSFL
jgi:hypothetical protein